MKILCKKIFKPHTRTIFGFFEKKVEIKQEEPKFQKVAKKSQPAKRMEIPGVKYILVSSNSNLTK